jgi:hypothetical protein
MNENRMPRKVCKSNKDDEEDNYRKKLQHFYTLPDIITLIK